MEEVGALDALVDILGDGDAGAGLGRALPVLLDELVGRPELLRGHDAHVHAEHRARLEQRAAHVAVGVAQEGEGDLLERFVRVLAHGQRIGQHLRRVELVGQTVVDRDAGILRQDLDQVLREAAVLDRVVHPPEHPGGVLHRFLVADLRSLGSEVGHVRALIVGRHLERAAGAGRGLLEDQDDLFLLELLFLGPVALRGLQLGGEIEERDELLLREKPDVEEVGSLQIHGGADGHRSVLLSSIPRYAVIGRLRSRTLSRPVRTTPGDTGWRDDLRPGLVALYLLS